MSAESKVEKFIDAFSEANLKEILCIVDWSKPVTTTNLKDAINKYLNQSKKFRKFTDLRKLNTTGKAFLQLKSKINSLLTDKVEEINGTYSLLISHADLMSFINANNNILPPIEEAEVIPDFNLDYSVASTILYNYLINKEFRQSNLNDLQIPEEFMFNNKLSKRKDALISYFSKEFSLTLMTKTGGRSGNAYYIFDNTQIQILEALELAYSMANSSNKEIELFIINSHKMTPTERYKKVRDTIERFLLNKSMGDLEMAEVVTFCQKNNIPLEFKKDPYWSCNKTKDDIVNTFNAYTYKFTTQANVVQVKEVKYPQIIEFTKLLTKFHLKPEVSKIEDDTDIHVSLSISISKDALLKSLTREELIQLISNKLQLIDKINL